MNRISSILSPLLCDHSVLFKDNRNKILGFYTGTGIHYILVHIVNNQIDIEFSRSSTTTTLKRPLPEQEPQAKPDSDSKQEPQPGPSSRHETVNTINDAPSPINPPATIDDFLPQNLTD